LNLANLCRPLSNTVPTPSFTLASPMRSCIAGWTNLPGVHRTGCGIARSGTIWPGLRKQGGAGAMRRRQRPASTSSPTSRWRAGLKASHFPKTSRITSGWASFEKSWVSAWKQWKQPTPCLVRSKRRQSKREQTGIGASAQRRGHGGSDRPRRPAQIASAPSPALPVSHPRYHPPATQRSGRWHNSGPISGAVWRRRLSSTGSHPESFT
jgi:hypothetical protein